MIHVIKHPIIRNYSVIQLIQLVLYMLIIYLMEQKLMERTCFNHYKKQSKRRLKLNKKINNSYISNLIQSKMMLIHLIYNP